MIELPQLVGVYVEHGDGLACVIRRLAYDGERNLALGPAVARDVAGKLFHVWDNYRPPGASAMKAHTAGFQDLAGDRPLVGPHVELIIGGHEVEAGPEVMWHLMM